MGTGGTPAVRSPQSHPRFARAIGNWQLAFSSVLQRDRSSTVPSTQELIANCYLLIAKFNIARRESGSTSCFLRAKGLSRLERPKTVKELEDDASQLEPSRGRLSPQ